MNNFLGDLLKVVAGAAKDELLDVREEFVKRLGVKSIDKMTNNDLVQGVIASSMLIRAIIESGRFRVESLSPSEVHDIERTIIIMLMQLIKTRHSHVSQADLDDFFDRFYKDENFHKGEQVE